MVDRQTIEIYEANAKAWTAQRAAQCLEQVAWVAEEARAADSGLALLDLGCGPGWHLEHLSGGGLAPAVGLDAAVSMASLAAERHPTSPVVVGDAMSLPFRSGTLGGAIVSRVYPHLPAADLPMALAELHRVLAIHSPVFLHLFAGRRGEQRSEDDFPGRLYSLLSAEQATDTLIGAGFQIERLEETADDDLLVLARRSHSLPDTVGPAMSVLVCGLNPSPYSADSGIGFGRPGNRFWPAALASGLVTVDRDPRAALRDHGVGMTDLVKRTTARAAELDPAEYRHGLERLDRLVAWLSPRVVCFVGLAGWRAAVNRRATAGWQDETVGGRPVYVLPSTSGLNANTNLEGFVDHFLEIRRGRTPE